MKSVSMFSLSSSDRSGGLPSKIYGSSGVKAYLMFFGSVNRNFKLSTKISNDTSPPSPEFR